MKEFEQEIINILVDLKENHQAIGIKAEFETEGTTIEEAIKLKHIAQSVGLDFGIKIGGCGAIKDLYDSKNIGANIIVAPMIESAYATQKFVQSFESAYDKTERKNTRFFINIETQTGAENFEKIINSNFFDNIDGIVFGRSDMAESLNIESTEINSTKLFEIANLFAQNMKKQNKAFIIGGGVGIKSIPFFKSLSYLSAFETRKIIFSSDAITNPENAQKGIIKAIEFELLWLKNRQEKLLQRKENLSRLKILEQRCNKL